MERVRVQGSLIRHPHGLWRAFVLLLLSSPSFMKKWLMAKHKKPLLEALEKVKSELMVLGLCGCGVVEASCSCGG
ncbi:hypothetical protein QQ045_012684 [Rhodiola kirilowii]